MTRGNYCRMPKHFFIQDYSALFSPIFGPSMSHFFYQEASNQKGVTLGYTFPLKQICDRPKRQKEMFWNQ